MSVENLLYACQQKISNKIDNSLPAVRHINHKYIVVENVSGAVMVDQAAEVPVHAAAEHLIYGGVYGDRPVAAVPVLQAAGKGLFLQVNIFARHPSV